MKSFCKPSFKNHNNSSLGTAAEAFDTKKFLDRARQHEIFCFHSLMFFADQIYKIKKIFLLSDTDVEKSSPHSFQMIPEPQYTDFLKFLWQ